MALVTYGPLVCRVAGAAGGTTFTRTIGGPAIKARTGRVNPATAKQLAARGQLAELSKLWATLTNLQQDAWAAATRQTPYRNKVGKTRFLPRFQFFCKVNMLRLAAGESYLTDAPTDFSIQPQVRAAALPFLTDAETTAIWALWNGGTEIVCTLKVAAGPATSIGAKPDSHQLRNIATFPPTTTAPQELTDAWAQQYGSLPTSTPYSLLLRFTPLNPDNGLAGTITDAIITIAGPPPSPPPTPGTDCSSAPNIEPGLLYLYNGSTTDQAWLELDLADDNDYTVIFATDDSTATPALQAGPDCSSLVNLHTFTQTDAYTFTAAAGTAYYLAAQPFAAATTWTAYFTPTLQPPLDQLWFGLQGGDPTIDDVNQLGQFTELDISGSDANPSWVCFDRAGNVWATLTALSKLSVTTPAGQTTTYDTPTADAQPYVIINGPDKNLWFTQPGTSQIGKATPTGTLTSYTTPTTPSTPWWITNGPDNNLWFTDKENGKINRISTSGTITEYPCPPGSIPTVLCVGPDRNLWACDQGNNTILRCTTAGQITAFTIPTPSSTPAYIAAGPNCTLWFTEATGNNVARIDLAGTITEWPIPTTDSQPSQIIYGPDNAMWFVEHLGNKIGRIDDDGTITEWPIAPAGALPAWITAGNDNDVWVPHSGAPSITHLTCQRVIQRYNAPSGLNASTNAIITPRDRDFDAACCCIPASLCCPPTCPPGGTTVPTYITQDGSGSAPNTLYFANFLTTAPTNTSPAPTDLLAVVQAGITKNLSLEDLAAYICAACGPSCNAWSSANLNQGADMPLTTVYTPAEDCLITFDSCYWVPTGDAGAGTVIMTVNWTDPGGNAGSQNPFGVPLTAPSGGWLTNPFTFSAGAGQPIQLSMTGGGTYGAATWSYQASMCVIVPTIAPPPPTTLPIIETTPGTYNGTVPDGITVLTVTCTGSGGNGGIGAAGLPSSGGGGGACAIATIAVTPGDTFTYTVPAAGGNASFNHQTTTITCIGGANGTIDGGPGGAATISGPWLTWNPFFGGSGLGSGSGGPFFGGSGGGGAAGDTSNGSNGPAATSGIGTAGGAGGSGAVQPGGAGGTGATYGTGPAATDGTAPGAGGGGDSADNQGAGNGAAGMVTISGT